MNVNDIEDVLNLGTILSTHGNNDAAHQPYLIAALLDWKNDGGDAQIEQATSKARAEFVAQQDHSAAEAAAAKAEAKAKPAAPPAKSKSRAKPPPQPSPDPSADDADF